MKTITALFVLAALLAPLSAASQQIMTVELGQQLKRPGNASPELYRFYGASGTSVQVSLTGPGKSALVLYTPAGEEMTLVKGDGTVTLKAILPLWNVFMISVLRESTAPFTLKFSGNTPDAHTSLFAHKVGFRDDKTRRCWIIPGVSKRLVSDEYSHIETIIPGSGIVSETFGKDGRSFNKTSVETRIAGDEVTYLSPPHDLGPKFTLSGLIGADPKGQYVGANCPAN